jgi:hypothetical protein
MLKSSLVLSLFIYSGMALAQDVDSGVTAVHKINIGEEADQNDTNFIGFDLDVKRLKVPGSKANVILRQMTKRVRVEFEGAGIPRGKYTLAVSANCPSGRSVSEGRYKADWTELHRFAVSTTHIETEKSAPDAALREGGRLILFGKSFGFFKVGAGGALDVIDCKPVK